MDLPVEVLHLIFQDFSQRNLVPCSLVCQSWHYAVQPLLYAAVEVRSKKTFHKLFKTLKKKRKNNGTYGSLVRSIDFYGVDRDVMLENQLAPLQQVCPNVKRIHFDNDGSDARPCLLKKWKQLEILCVDPQLEPNSTWHHAAGQLSSLSITRQVYLFVRISRQTEHYQPPTLASVLPPKLSRLTELYVDVHKLDSGKSSAEFLDCLATRCPSLTKLTLNLQQVNRDDMNKIRVGMDGSSGINNDSNSGADTAKSFNNTVTALTILANEFHTHIPLYPHYAKLFPKLEELNLDLTTSDIYYYRHQKEQHREAYYDMISRLPHLISFSLHITLCLAVGTQSTDLDDLIPTIAMLENWMVGRQIKRLVWPSSSLFGLPTLSSAGDLQHRLYLYLDQLAILEVAVDNTRTPAELLRFLLHNNTRSTLPAQLTSLTLDGQCANIAFDMPSWRKASPRLQQLKLRSMEITDDDSSSNSGSSSSSDDYTDNEEHDRIEPFAELTALTLENGKINLSNGFTDLLTWCVNLKHLNCTGVTIHPGGPQQQHPSLQRITNDDGQSTSFVYMVNANSVDFDTLILRRVSILIRPKAGIYHAPAKIVTNLCLVEQGRDDGNSPLWVTSTSRATTTTHWPTIVSTSGFLTPIEMVLHCHMVDNLIFRW